LLVRPGDVTTVFHINVIIAGQNIFQMWNITYLTHPILFSVIFFQPFSEYVLKQKFKS